MSKHIRIHVRAWAEIVELFGDGMDYEFALDPDNYVPDDLIGETQESVTIKKKEVKLKDLYEPGVIAQKMLTEEDEIIRSIDVPERYQVDRKNFPDPDEGQLTRESLFIARHLKRDDSFQSSSNNPLVKVILDILKFIRIDQLEIPFIATHRKDYFVPQLEPADLWTIYDLDEAFLTIEMKRRNLKASFDDIQKKSAEAAKDTYANDQIEKSSTLDEIADMQLYLQVHYGLDIAETDAQKARIFKKPTWRVAYEGAKRNNLGKFATMFGVDSKLFSQSLITRQALHFPEDHARDPEESAEEYICTLFPTVEKVLMATREMIAQEIAADPTLRNFLRRVYSTDAVITVTPTSKGKTEIKPGHKYYVSIHLCLTISHLNI
jgi:transcription elongation factor SPT6